MIACGSSQMDLTSNMPHVKARKHGLKSSSLKSKKENHLELSQDVKLMNTI